jgi:SAM-dependent methyltransferase
MKTTPDSWKPFAAAMRRYFAGDANAKIVVHNDFGERDEYSMAYFYREPAEFPPLEQTALELCRGRVLDVGAGAGCHSLALEERGIAVTALEISPELVAIMQARGGSHAYCCDIYDFEADPFDTVLMLMNGLELAGTLVGLEQFLRSIHRLVKADGQILADSTDLRAGYGSGPGRMLREDGRYVGELVMQLEFDGERGAPLPRLYVDPDALAEYAGHYGWHCSVVSHNDAAGYLARLTPQP